MNDKTFIKYILDNIQHRARVTCIIICLGNVFGSVSGNWTAHWSFSDRYGKSRAFRRCESACAAPAPSAWGTICYSTYNQTSTCVLIHSSHCPHSRQNPVLGSPHALLRGHSLLHLHLLCQPDPHGHFCACSRPPHCQTTACPRSEKTPEPGSVQPSSLRGAMSFQIY